LWIFMKLKFKKMLEEAPKGTWVFCLFKIGRKIFELKE
jgi:hypothetical protein